ncbi:MAG TPA: glycosyltransferase family 4 protein [Phycisphaerae bacterium]|nr:glycosyltransferase family 4 protein [Phycisphaerae bacterium]HNU46313.1 glycosyltransferase family 4 protein [Phycisphaerae bacterium]
MGQESDDDPVSVQAAGRPLHHVIFASAMAVRRGERVFLPSHWEGNFRAYGELVPGTVVVLPEDRNLSPEVAVPLDERLRPILLPGFTTRSLLRRTLAYVRGRRVIRDLVRRAEFVQIQHISTFGFIAGAAAVQYRKTLYLDMGATLHEPPGAPRNDRPWHADVARVYYQRLERKIARHAKLFIAVSAHLHGTIPDARAPRVVVSHSMIEKECIFERDNACAGESLNVFVATRMVQSKGIQHLLGALRLLGGEGLDVRAQIAGVGDYLEDLKQRTSELGLDDKVRFLGGIPGGGEELWSHFRRADMAVLPSLGHYEGTPRMILESWAAGAPVVATTVGGIPTLVRDEEDGLLVPPGNEPALARAMRRVYEDADLRRRLVANGYRRVASMTYEGRLPILKAAFQQHLPGLLPEGSS